MSTATRRRRRPPLLTPQELHAKSEKEYEDACDDVFRTADVLADYMEDGGVLVTDFSPGLTRMCRQFIELRTAVDRVQEAAHRLGIRRMLVHFDEHGD